MRRSNSSRYCALKHRPICPLGNPFTRSNVFRHLSRDRFFIPTNRAVSLQQCSLFDHLGWLFAVGTRVTSRPPHRSVRAQFGHTACMGLSLSRGRYAILVVLCIPFFCSTRAASFFRPDRIFPSPSRAAAVKDGASSAPPKACP
jgi:hypothetical protein